MKTKRVCRNEWTRFKERVSPEQKAEMKRLYEAGWGYKRIAKAFGYTGVPGLAKREGWVKDDALKWPAWNKGKRNITDAAVGAVLEAVFRHEMKCAKRGDEATHWGRHPEFVNWYLLRRYYADPESHNKRCMARRKKDPEKFRAYMREYKRARMMSDPVFKASELLRIRLSGIVKRCGAMKPCSTEELLGCPWLEFKYYIEKQFKRGMTWENHGTVWHIDHIQPCASFDLTDERQVRMCFHFTNLRPLAARANMRKSARITEPQLVMAI